MKTIMEALKRYRWVLLAGIIVAVMIGMITANLNVLRFMAYRMQGNEQGVISILDSSVKSSEGQSEWYFEQGIDYLLSSKKLSEESLAFFEENFERFEMATRLDILNGYNRNKLLLDHQLPVMETILTNLDHTYSQEYIKRMPKDQLEQGLAMYYGDNPKVNEAFIESMYKVLRIYPNEIAFDKFQFNLYPILALEGAENNQKKVAIFSKLRPDNAKESLFKALKQEKIEGEKLREWVELLNQTHILDHATYTKFNTIYSNIYLIRNQYKALDNKEIELKNKKEAVDVQIEQSIKDLQSKDAQLTILENEIKDIDSKLNAVTNYAYMALFIEKASATGTNEYEASIPRRGLFGDYKASDQKYIVKLSQTSFLTPGVYYVDIYLKGTKVSGNGNEYPYYVEVSNSDLSSINTLQQERTQKSEEKTLLEQEIAALATQIDKVKQEADYDKNDDELKNMVLEREALVQALNEKVVEIKLLFGLGQLNIEMREADVQ